MSAPVFTIGLHNDAGTLVRTFRLPFAKLDATAAPGVSDDDTEGFVAGSIWADRTGDTVYVCTDNATGAAIWIELVAAAEALDESRTVTFLLMGA